jgi:hypothetical protein
MRQMSDDVQPGLLVLHGNRTELLGEALFDWLARQPLRPFEQEIFLVACQVLARSQAAWPVLSTWLPLGNGWTSCSRCPPTRQPRSTGRKWHVAWRWARGWR